MVLSGKGEENRMTFTDMRMIYGHLQDGISRKLFTAKLNALITGNPEHFTMLPAEYRNLNADIEGFRKALLSEDRERTVIFGAGFNGISMAKQIHIKSLIAFIDNYKDGQIEVNAKEIPVFSMEEYMDQYGFGNTRFVISVSDRGASAAMHSQLVKAGVDPGAILIMPVEYRNNTSQYFDLLVPDEHETFVDCGCYDASTAFRFAGWCGMKGYDRIWCFEPDKTSYKRCKELCAGLKNCTVYPYGILDQAGSVPFQSGRKEESKIITPEEGTLNEVIETIVLDDFLQGERVTFMKMDIEGAELDALKGASRIIKEQKPKLAISVYHKEADIIEIPRLLLELRPDYRLYLRHYSLLLNEIVLYAY